MKKISEKLILLIAIIMFVLATNSKSVYGYFTSSADTTSNAIGTDFYGGINTKVTCTVTGKNKAKITLKNNGSLTCKSKIKILLPNDVTYTISDSNWTKDGEDWVSYNNVINSQETVELNINLNVPSNKETKFNINVIEKAEPADTNSGISKRKIVTNRALNTTGQTTTTTGSIATAISQGENIIAGKIYNSSEDKFEEVNNEWNIANETLKIGKKYQSNLRVYNPEGGIDEYARATIYLQLVDEAGNIITDENIYKKIEDAIDIEYGENWIYDEGATAITQNKGIRKVLYHSKIIKIGEHTSNFLSGITLNGKILNAKSTTARTENNGTVNTITYDLEGMKLQIEVQVETVQTGHAEDAILSSWGRQVNIAEDGTLSLL